MSEHAATVSWQRDGATFTDGRYHRRHTWRFDGGVEVPASASPHVVPPPLSTAAAVDPEEAFVAALASCHMLWFLALAARAGFAVDGYLDQAVGVLGRDAGGRMAMTRVTLRPAVRWAGERRPTATEVGALHRDAHEQCFLARSVVTEVRCEPVDAAETA